MVTCPSWLTFEKFSYKKCIKRVRREEEGLLPNNKDPRNHVSRYTIHRDFVDVNDEQTQA